MDIVDGYSEVRVLRNVFQNTLSLSLLLFSFEFCVVLNLINLHLVTSVVISLSLRYISFSLSNLSHSLYNT